MWTISLNPTDDCALTFPGCEAIFRIRNPRSMWRKLSQTYPKCFGFPFKTAKVQKRVRSILSAWPIDRGNGSSSCKHCGPTMFASASVVVASYCIASHESEVAQ